MKLKEINLTPKERLLIKSMTFCTDDADVNIVIDRMNTHDKVRKDMRKVLDKILLQNKKTMKIKKMTFTGTHKSFLELLDFCRIYP